MSFIFIKFVKIAIVLWVGSDILHPELRFACTGLFTFIPIRGRAYDIFFVGTQSFFNQYSQFLRIIKRNSIFAPETVCK